jgi:predicted ferric reductase
MINSQLYWYVGRGSGIVAYLLLTMAVVLGIALSQRWSSPAWPRLVVHEAHRWATITLYLFLVVHVAMMFVDSYAGFSVADLLIPFASGYRTLWLSLGIIGAELAFAIGASVWVRAWIGYRTWYALHALSYPIFVASLLHGIGTGTDTEETWAVLLYGISACAVLAVTFWRTVRLPRARAALVAATLLALVLMVNRLS